MRAATIPSRRCLPDLEAATGWTKAELALGPTLAFLIMAGLTPFTGRLVDRGLGGEMLIWLPGLAALGVAGLGLVGLACRVAGAVGGDRDRAGGKPVRDLLSPS
jgi:hypothetical protein